MTQVVVVDERADPDRLGRRRGHREVRDRAEAALDEMVGDRERRDARRFGASRALGEVATVDDVVGVGHEREGLHGAIVAESAILRA